MNSWIYQQNPYQLPPDADYKTLAGFVYLITNTVNDKKYIGKKLFFASRSKQVKGKKKKFKVESDWKSYMGSSEALHLDIQKYGEDRFTREILFLCSTKAECSYYESYWIFLSQALIRPDEFYNQWISCRIRSSHLTPLHLHKIHPDSYPRS